MWAVGAGGESRAECLHFHPDREAVWAWKAPTTSIGETARKEMEMSSTVKEVEYYYAIVADRPGEARKLLEFLSEKMVNLLALTAFPIGEGKSQIDFFPAEPEMLKKAAADAKMELVGPKKAFLIQGVDRIGALYDFHLKLSNAGINIYACNGVVDGTGRYGYVIWVDQADYEQASKALKTSDWRTIQPSRRV
jgi:hypothetical protein